MEFFFIVILVAAELAVASIKKKPQSYYRKRQAPTWAAPIKDRHPPTRRAKTLHQFDHRARLRQMASATTPMESGLFRSAS